MNLCKKIFFLLMITLSWELKAQGSEETVFTGTFGRIYEAITGDLGVTLASIALAVSGIMAAFGALRWLYFVMVLLGVAILFGADDIVAWIRG
ncbi:TrbC/VirB2 family protein [Marinicella sp. W31]|uniref:TrbC/VirB2 family protein n=1 Tax=Marinicella sp. W31 TaxID=3023713 RepID=UPI003758294B